MIIIIIVIIVMAKEWGRDLPAPSPGAYNANIQPLYAQDCPCVTKNHILQEAALLINRTWRI
jgi:hypothetical protein